MAKVWLLTIVLAAVCRHNSAYAGFTTTLLGPQPIWNSTHTDKLRKDLLLNYDKFARPAQHYNVTTVQLGLQITHIEVNEFKSSFTVYSMIRMKWTDEKLKWDPTKYGGLTVLNVADHEIWQPDIVLYNSPTGAAISHYRNVYCLVYNNGTVLWVPPTQLTALCTFNLKQWPFDGQECKLIFGSWSQHGDAVDLELYNNQNEAGTDLLVEANEWKIVKTSVTKNVKYYSCCKEPYPDIIVQIFLERTSQSYKALIVTPAFVTIILILSTFWLPPHAGEKIVLNGCTAIVICIFMLYFTQKLPAMGNHTPLIVLFYSSCLHVVGFATIASVVVIWLSRTKHDSPVPQVIRQPLMGMFGKLLGLGIYIQESSKASDQITAEEMRDHQVTDFEENNRGDERHIIKSSTKIPIQHHWILLAAAIDRVLFCIFCFVFLVLTIVYSV